MKKKSVITVILALVLMFSLSHYAVEAEEDQDRETDRRFYTEELLEDFEETVFTGEHITFIRTVDQEADLQIREEYPAPVQDSTKYLGVKVNGRFGDVFKIKPPEDLTIEGHARSIELWVYGKNFSGELSLLLQDAEDQVHRLVFGRLNFLGWRKMRVMITPHVRQQHRYLHQDENMRILEFQYRPQNRERATRWHYFYIDHITTTVRERYRDRQSDDW